MLRRIVVAALLGLTVAAGFGGALTATSHVDTATDCDPAKRYCGPPQGPWEWD